MAKQEETTEGFLNYLASVSSMAMVAHGVGLGSALGIFDVMSGFTEPKTCEEIAAVGNWKPRYIKEWLALMTCGKIVNYNMEGKTYYIPKHKQVALASKGKGVNAAVFMQGIHVASQVTPELKSCFDLDGPRGIPYSSYTGFHEWRTARIQTKYTVEIINNILQTSPELVKKLKQGIQVVDGGCSTGHQVTLLAEMHPNSTFLAFDIDKDAVKTAQTLAKQKGLKNVTFQVQDGCNMPPEWTDNFDVFMVWDVVHDVPHSKKFLKEIYRVLKPGGMFFMNDIKVHSELGLNVDNPVAVLPYGLSLFHCMPVSLHFEGGEGLGAAWGIEKQEEYLKDAGFTDIVLLPVKDAMQTFFTSYKSK